MSNKPILECSNNLIEELTRKTKKRIRNTAISGIAGGVTGAALGAVGGPIGAAIGGAGGAITGTVSGFVEDEIRLRMDAKERSNRKKLKRANELIKSNKRRR
jgi:uncharacterized protein YcfJ